MGMTQRAPSKDVYSVAMILTLAVVCQLAHLLPHHFSMSKAKR
nr:hypothetical protein BOSE7B_90083 [Bosea sp. 7B]